jgi:hypothetical protein
MTDSDELQESVGGGLVKRDALGRVRTNRQEREALLEEFGRSGLSGPQFARVAGVKYQTLATWRQQQNKSHRRKGQAVAVHTRANFVEAEVSGEGDALVEPVAALRVHLPQGAWLELNHPHQVPLVVALVKELGRPC